MQFNEKNILIRHLTSFIEIDNYSDYKNVPQDNYNRNMILSSKLKNYVIYAADSSRALGTVKYVAEMNNLKIKLDDRINERNLDVKQLVNYQKSKQ